MKKVIFATLLMAMCSFAVQGQNNNENNNRTGVEAISYDELEDWSRNQNGYYDAYLSRDGHVYHRGDKVTFGPTSDGKTYRYMWERVNALHLLADVPTVPISGKWAGKTGVIKNIIVTGNKKKGHELTVVLAVGSSSRIEVRPFEMALSSGEIISQGMTKELALKELKEAKDLVDLGLITAEEYEAKKRELSKYILGK